MSAIASRGGGERLSTVEGMLANRAHGHEVEQWVAELLREVHQVVSVVGGQHFPSAWGWDIEADGIAYEVKSCMERVARRGVRKGTRPGRWKIDTLAHAEILPEQAQRTMYILVVSDAAGPKTAYLVSHARMSGILARYTRQGQFVSVTTSVWAPRLVPIYRRRRRA